MGSGAFRHFAEVRFSRFWPNASKSCKNSIFPGFVSRQKQYRCKTPYTLYILMDFVEKRWVGGVKIFGHTIDLCKNSV